MGLFCLLPEGGGGRSSQIARMSLISTFQVKLSLRGFFVQQTSSESQHRVTLITPSFYQQVPIAVNTEQSCLRSIREKKMWTFVYLQKREEE